MRSAVRRLKGALCRDDDNSDPSMFFALLWGTPSVQCLPKELSRNSVFIKRAQEIVSIYQKGADQKSAD